MSVAPTRITDGRNLGQAKRLEGLTLGSLALIPILLAAPGIWLTFDPWTSRITFAVIAWSGALLTFFAGVRRGLTFSEAGGARPSEIAAVLWIFLCGVGALLLHNAVAGLSIAIVGFASVGLLDAWAANSEEAPSYFSIFRPLQAIVAIAALALILARILTG